ncbi:5-formyltetrahydrofolate cyclo-ligase [Thermoplasmatales archaeon SG8-52-1]|jgi:5-formyltetrahydrofolate cyclo-ligase|nr:MAG: 5-formyltetrahydrofolate cyclo-ligase [Thermoplasmatales archaeon SG8-52-1]
MKNQIRKKLILIRKNLSKEYVFENSNKIKNKLFNLNEFKQASTILFYVSYNNEVYTHEMIKELLASKKNIVVPISDKNNRILILSKLENWDDLSIGSYNILEPKKDIINQVDLDSIDLIIVPGVGFDEGGNRIGHGKGYYDNLLRNSKQATSIGLSFECQIVDKISTGKYDIPIDIIVTEKRIIKNY